ncbi:uncharacterized protein MYCFIDRAFT_88924 [Pseudocercospora fijiensis CIRAD86]|uniref:Rhodopsin domain-containing protein n=1 Tax=Pseudocercospora fijiensis (strain CIRAD86) TaxID=383855 RepID=M2YGB0_PSEFD|nr:uncharacterized protein MYCFIDRAFT_88924 [Pseudocercospora fijiensis CIRAD86]EME76840.1 hypothetical protein MYCFIDRAFT_88924 [Pseudocercospora fijiensis CIRAD86]
MASLQLPACAVACSKYIGKHDKICSYHKVFTSAVTRCVQKKCPTLEDVLQWQTQYASVCGLPPRDQGTLEISVTYALFAVATVSFAGRLLSRSKFMNGLGFWWDDLLVLVLWMMSIELVVCLAIMRHNGAGRDAIDWISRDHVERVLLWVYASEPFYIIGTYSSKLVWVLLYLRMWEANTMFRKVCWGTAGLMIMGLVGFGVAAIAVFWPHQYYMGDSAVVRTHRSGIDLIPAVLSIGVLNVAGDFWVLLLPIPKLITLDSITRQRRMWICTIFLLGFVVTVCSMVRFTTILPLRNTTNATWDFGHFVIWSEIEIHLSVVTCNLPALAGLIHRLRWRHRRCITSQGEEDQQPSGIARSNATKQGTSVFDKMCNVDDDLCEDSNGRIVRREKDPKPPD